MRRHIRVSAAHAGVAVFAAVFACAAIAPPRASAVVIDFAALPAGHVLQSSDFPAGTTLTVINNNAAHPNSALVFNSACTVGTCSGGDDDLRTPGVGPGNTIPHGKVMIVAEDVTDTNPADGIVDDPDDAKRGGTITLQFSVPYKLNSVRGIDFETAESPARVEIDKVGGGTVVFPFTLLGDNSAETLAIVNPPPAVAIRFLVKGTGAFDEFNLVLACGDGVLDTGEDCDPPGSPVGNERCSAGCTLVAPSCGNSVIGAIDPGLEVTDVPHNRALCQSAVTLAGSGNADAIVAVTRGGKTAHMLSAFRPAVRIFAVTPDAAIARRFAIYSGVLPLVADIDPTGLAIERQLRERNLLPAGSVVVFLSVNADLTRADANFLRIRRI